ncbi:CPBP family intramembrane glutamic endopeptidase [Saccharopolyspora mangrovi]|uniref:Type II CAAX endopeptidase family protein n=1 Tax=Saccharopolyspora mangrovi TaxID=3082379 RepID=A0ABU6A4R2_9PSEU|nr:type II CAAX endopeptidase family protein [Saccharopolyspora sp. S2-29]MEB3366564.1 type II CAAX endopeptidase family protein [Saccharopolyspora sp. S2-29]
MPATEERSAQGGRAGLLMMVVFAAAVITFLGTSMLALVLAETPGNVSPAAMLANLTGPGVLAALVAITGTALLGAGPGTARIRRELALRWSWRAAGHGLLIGAVGLAVSLPAAMLWTRWVGPDQAESALGETFRGKQFGLPVAGAVFLIIWLLAPICEELLFRGVLWRAFEHWRWNAWGILAITTVLFALAHAEPLRTPLLLIISIPVGVARMLTGNLTAAIVTHQLNNFLPALLVFLLVSE